MKNKISKHFRKTYACVVDGETEIWYLNMLRRNEPSLRAVSIKPELPQRKTISEQYRQVCTMAQSYSDVIWIVDVDTTIREDRVFRGPADLSPRSVLKKCISELPDNVTFIANVPCLEFWVLLHVLRTSKYYDSCEAVVNEIRRHNPLKSYEKSAKYFTKPGRDIYTRLKPYLEDALKNSESTGNFDPDNLEKGVSEMYKLFRKLGLD